MATDHSTKDNIQSLNDAYDIACDVSNALALLMKLTPFEDSDEAYGGYLMLLRETQKRVGDIMEHIQGVTDTLKSQEVANG